MIPDILKEVAEYLKRANWESVLVKTGSDARVDSSQSEAKIIQVLQNANKWHVYSPNIGTSHNRAWYDVQIDGHHCDIKISTCSTNDNTNAKKAIYYLLTGDEEAEKAPNANDQFFKQMKERESPDEDRDFYYLVVNKAKPGDVFFVSLRGMAQCSPSPNNLPFQATWARNREPVKRSWREAKNYLLGKWAESIARLIKIQQDGMPTSYPEFFPREAP